MKYLITIIILSFSSIAYSQEIVTDRPDQTESSVSVSPGIIQVESGFLFQRNDYADGISIKRSVYPTSLFRIGIVKKLELRIVNEISSYEIGATAFNDSVKLDLNYSGTEDMQVGFKYQFTDTESRFVVAFIGHLIVPTGSKGLSTEDFGMNSRLSFSTAIDEKRSLGVNLGYSNTNLDLRGELEAKNEGNFFYTFSYGHSLGDRVGVYMEFYGDYVEMEDWANNMDAGITYLLKDNIQLDYSYGWGLEYNMNYHSIGVSFYLPSNSQM